MPTPQHKYITNWHDSFVEYIKTPLTSSFFHLTSSRRWRISR